MEQNNNANTHPRIPLPDFEVWLVHQPPEHVLTVKAYLYCVDGCAPDEVTQRFAMVEGVAQRAGAAPERIARWHREFGEMWSCGHEMFRRIVYDLERNEYAAMTGVLTMMSEVDPRRAEYLIEPYLPLGMLTVLGGVSGVGKTWLALHWAAQVSNSFAVDAPGAVYYFTQENDPCIVLQPRLQLLGANMSRIAIQRFDTDAPGLTLDDPRLEAAAQLIPPRLVIFDPIQSYLGAGVEMNKANEVRPILDWLSRFAQRYRCAVVLVSHMSKPNAANGEALDRLLGSSDFRNAARSIIIVGRDPDAPDVRVFAHAKNSIGQPGPSQRYRVGSYGVDMLGECELTANDIIKVGAKSAGRPATSLNVAVEALKELLGDKGWASYEDVVKMCKAKNIAQTTLYRAKSELHIKQLRVGSASIAKRWWLLPSVDASAIPLAG